MMISLVFAVFMLLFAREALDPWPPPPPPDPACTMIVTTAGAIVVCR